MNKTLYKIYLQRLYRNTEKEYTSHRIAGNYSMCDKAIDALINIEDEYTRLGYDSKELAITDYYELLAQEIESLPISTQIDMIDYYNGRMEFWW